MKDLLNTLRDPQRVIIMDNASFHHTIKEMCLDTGVELIYLQPYSPDLNPIEEFFAELKQSIKKRWDEYKDNPGQGFDSFLKWCVYVVGSRFRGAEGHFRKPGVLIERYIVCSCSYITKQA
jgi:transposase